MGGVNNDGAEVVCVGLKGVHLLQSVVIEHPHKHVVLQDKSKNYSEMMDHASYKLPQITLQQLTSLLALGGQT